MAPLTVPEIDTAFSGPTTHLPIPRNEGLTIGVAPDAVVMAEPISYTTPLNVPGAAIWLGNSHVEGVTGAAPLDGR
jgi:hypothetical protein